VEEGEGEGEIGRRQFTDVSRSHSNTDRETERQRDRETERQRDRETERQRRCGAGETSDSGGIGDRGPWR
jgi:hypothetical protein